ncbi:MAG: chemotaxis-specific protein-glutamate methyltransferase CheB [Lachnoclostridium sp.]|nr:chemotaxis-specific protein-glutamate methyltransferase CheB [Lachnospira sp.]MCM1246843.1 chemotaxis-specific protein-glutamate methyltransferase CheB [Lachnoclostridium sp.]
MAVKKILIVDDSALMRSVLCDIINSDKRFQIVDRAKDGVEAFDLLSRNTYDAVILDVNMPRMNGLELMRKLRQYGISARILVASTDTKKGNKTAIEALEAGAVDIIHKPDKIADCRVEEFKREFLNVLTAVSESELHDTMAKETAKESKSDQQMFQKVAEILGKSTAKVPGQKIVAIASSTGGPTALQAVIPKLPANLDAPVLLVQHMNKSFTPSFAERLNELSALTVKEAAEGMELKKGTVYVARGGMHMKVETHASGRVTIHMSDEPTREGVKPCANYMYESLMGSPYDNIVCVVMTGMGADGTEGIKNLKTAKKTHVITQSADTCVVYGMPKAAAEAGLSDQTVPLKQIAQEIILHIGVE